MFDKTIDALRRGTLELDFKRMTLSQRTKDGERFEGPGYIRQSPDGTLTFKIYVTQHSPKPLKRLGDVQALPFKPGAILGDDSFYDLDATAHDGAHWTATEILPVPQWHIADLNVLVSGRVPSVTAHYEVHSDRPQSWHHLRLHFFEEYEVPLRRIRDIDGRRVRDSAVFDACGSKFTVLRRDGDTIVDAISENPFPPVFDLRLQEALQYITAKTAGWRVRLEETGAELHLELASPGRRPSRTQLTPPISPAFVDYNHHGWRLFKTYLEYLAANTQGPQWNPVAYYLNNARESTAGSVDAQAVGVAVAVEAVASLIGIKRDEKKVEKLALLLDRTRKWLADQSDLQDEAKRIGNALNGLRNKRVQDTLHALAATGHVEKDYIKAWTHLRNRHVHPNIKDLKTPDQAYHENLLYEILCVEVLLYQLTFSLIGYEGPYTDGGVSKQYPLTAAQTAPEEGPS